MSFVFALFFALQGGLSILVLFPCSRAALFPFPCKGGEAFSFFFFLSLSLSLSLSFLLFCLLVCRLLACLSFSLFFSCPLQVLRCLRESGGEWGRGYCFGGDSRGPSALGRGSLP